MPHLRLLGLSGVLRLTKYYNSSIRARDMSSTVMSSLIGLIFRVEFDVLDTWGLVWSQRTNSVCETNCFSLILNMM